MTVSRRLAFMLMAGILCLGGMELGARFSVPGVPSIVSIVEARVGRPMTPVSVAGVARRTTRRTIRRTTAYVASLPMGCSIVMIDGMQLHLCGTTYYQAHNNQYVVVTVN